MKILTAEIEKRMKPKVFKRALLQRIALTKGKGTLGAISDKELKLMKIGKGIATRGVKIGGVIGKIIKENIKKRKARKMPTSTGYMISRNY